LQRVRLRSALVVVRFLKATRGCAVWYEFFDPKKQSWSQPRLLLATDTPAGPAVLRVALVNRIAVPQSQTLVGREHEQSLAAIAPRARVMDASPIDWLCPNASACSASAEALPFQEIAPWRKGEAASPDGCGNISPALRFAKPTNYPMVLDPPSAVAERHAQPLRARAADRPACVRSRIMSRSN